MRDGWITKNQTTTCSKFHGESSDHLSFFAAPACGTLKFLINWHISSKVWSFLLNSLLLLLLCTAPHGWTCTLQNVNKLSKNGVSGPLCLYAINFLWNFVQVAIWFGVIHTSLKASSKYVAHCKCFLQKNYKDSLWMGFLWKKYLNSLRFSLTKKINPQKTDDLLNDKIYSSTKENNLVIWQNWCFGQLYYQELRFCVSVSLVRENLRKLRDFFLQNQASVSFGIL